jgi:hypothetical protein
MFLRKISTSVVCLIIPRPIVYSEAHGDVRALVVELLKFGDQSQTAVCLVFGVHYFLTERNLNVPYQSFGLQT